MSLSPDSYMATFTQGKPGHTQPRYTCTHVDYLVQVSFNYIFGDEEKSCIVYVCGCCACIALILTRVENSLGYLQGEREGGYGCQHGV